MRLKPEQFATHLQGSLAPLYGLFSSEPLLLIEAEQAVRGAAARAGFAQTEVWTVEPGFDFRRLEEAQHSLSLFAERRLLILRLGAGKPGDVGGKLLQAWAAQPPAEVLLLVTGERPDAAAQKAGWFKALESAGAVVLFYPPEPRQWPQWVAGRLRQAGLRASAEAQALLAERTEGNLLACVQAIDQLRLLSAGAEVAPADVLAVIGDSARYSVFDLADAALRGEARQALHILDHLRLEGIEPILVLWALTRDLRLLIALQGRRTDPAALWREHKIFGPRQELLQRVARSRRSEDLIPALRLCARLDEALKGRAALPVWPTLAEVALRLAGQHGLVRRET
ncbi:DNA polymerase III subunit delta [Thermithiobacillus tepidarius DSM 3134]|uniref:DNA polymerase III subunit delta n=1 Tax=Thermithiobacillus tepidarius TaxID=929 RepID=UPI0003FB002D|nr:DNA polymerase III subunit delta [Thermithiobacillus tepidarius]